MNGGIRLWARSELRARWRGLVALGLLGAVAVGLATASVAGARRTATAYARYRTATAAADAIVFATQVQAPDTNFPKIRALPEVLAAGEFTLAPVGLEGEGSGTLAPGDDQLGLTVDRPLLVSGRRPNPRRADEIVLNRVAAHVLHARVGSHFTVVSGTNQAAFFGQAPMDGPRLSATVVGIGDSGMDEVFAYGQPGFTPSGGFLATYGDVVPHPGNLVVRLRPGTNFAAFVKDVEAAMGRSDVPVRDLSDDAKRVTHATELERIALLLFAASVAASAAVLIGQAVARAVYVSSDSVPSLRAIGFTRRDAVAGGVLPITVTAGVAAVGAVAVAIALSPIFPVGLAGRLEPDRGLHVDLLVVVSGAIGAAALVVFSAAVAAARSTRSGSEAARTAAAPRGWATSAGLIPAAVGVDLAVGGGRGMRRVPGRPAVAGAVVAVVGVIGSFGLIHGIDDALSHPARSGRTWDLEAVADDQHPPDQLALAVAGLVNPQREATIIRHPMPVNGQPVPVYTIETIHGTMTFGLLSGRRPDAPDEIVLGPSTMRALHVRLGGRVVMPTGLQDRVVGTALLPQTPHSSFDQGAWVTTAGLTRAGGSGEADQGEVSIAFTVARPKRAAEEATDLQSKLGGEIDVPESPQDVVSLRNIKTLPKALTAFLVLVGVAAVGHALASAVRRRRYDLAVLRALGFRPIDAAAVVMWMAAAVAAAALVFGVPIGISTGRLVWRWVADRTPLVVVLPGALVVVAAAVPGALAIAGLLALVPARRAARDRPTEVLRAE